MAWVVKQWRLESLERLLADEALERLRAVRESADRDARRARREADRTAGEADRELAALEQLGEELTLTVRRRRAAVRETRAGAMQRDIAATFRGRPIPAPGPIRAPGPVPEPLPIPQLLRLNAAPVADAVPAADGGGGATPELSAARNGRASLRSSGLAELFRVTDARPVAPPGAP